MSINWNKEVKWKDVQKFFNQEVHIGEIDYHKCLQVSALIVDLQCDRTRVSFKEFIRLNGERLNFRSIKLCPCGMKRQPCGDFHSLKV